MKKKYKSNVVYFWQGLHRFEVTAPLEFTMVTVARKNGVKLGKIHRIVIAEMVTITEHEVAQRYDAMMASIRSSMFIIHKKGVDYFNKYVEGNKQPPGGFPVPPKSYDVRVEHLDSFKEHLEV